MGQIVVRRIDESIIEAVKARAKANNRSTEAEVRAILKEAVAEPPMPPRASLLRLAGSAPTNRTAEEIVAEVRALRAEMDR